MVVITLFLSLATIALILVFYLKKGFGKSSLPGPVGLPIFGYLPFITKKPYIVFQKLSKKYGPLYNVRLGNRKILILCEFNVIKEAFADEAFMGRPHDLPFDLSETTKKTGAFFDLQWKEQRKFALHTLRDLGFGKTRMEGQLKEEIDEVLNRLRDLNGKPIKMSDIMAPSASNNIASLLFGKRMKFDDPRRKKLDKQMSDIGLLAGAVGWQLFFPWIGAFMRYFRIGSNGKLSRALAEMREYCVEELEEHEKTFNPNNIRDFLDRYLIEIEKNKQDAESGFKREVLIDLSRAFFGAGSETVRKTTDWLTLVAAAFPETQKKVHCEIDEVLGRDQFPTWEDRFRLPYTEAFILELMRWKTILPLNVMHSTLKDTELNGYFIPKNTDVLAILYCLDHDENLWGKDANEFKPDRFLSKDRTKIVKPDYFIPFSIGKRSCPGKTLGEIEVFLYFTAILQKFRITMPLGKTADLEEILGIGLQPKRQDICLHLR